MIHIGYKVVTQQFTSCMAQGKYRLNYPLGEVVNEVPNTLGIMCFDTYNNAVAFIDSFGLFGLTILLVAYESRDIKHRVTKISRLISESTLDFYYHYNTTLGIKGKVPPQGTIFCSRVKVIAKEEVILP